MMTKKIAHRWIERNQDKIARLNMGKPTSPSFAKRLKLCTNVILAETIAGK
jgi:hypothetical protein